MIKKLLTFTIMLFTVAAIAQQQPQANKYGPYVTNKFFDNWFISVGGGVQVLYGEHDTKADFADRLAPALDISLGKWITPSIGVRAQYAGLKAKGVTTSSSAKFVTGASSDLAGYYDEEFNFFNLHGDLLWNISNTIGGYRMDRTWDFIPFVGFGYAKSWKKNVNPEYKEVSATAGLLNELRLSDAVNLNLELRVLMVNDRFDGYQVGQGIEEIVSATIGFTYNFAKRGFDRYVEPIAPDYSSYNNKISELDKRIADADAKAKKLASDLAAEKARKPETITSVEYVAAPLAIFFPIGQARLTDKDLINLASFAEVLKKSGKSYKIMGSADKATGSKAINQKLSQARADAVYNALVNKFGVKGSQLQVIAKGEENEPFDKPILNRVVILE
ncbi:MAG: OmpA family protein [Bacteroidales bacterium]